MALLEKLAKKEMSKTQILKLAEADFSLIPAFIEGTSSPKATIRYGCSSVLLNLSDLYPDELYPYFDRFFVLWTASLDRCYGMHWRFSQT